MKELKQKIIVPENRRIVKALLVAPKTGTNFRAGTTKLTKFFGMSALYPPLGILTVAAYLPEWWDIRFIDMNVEQLTDNDLMWAECVLLTGIIGQLDSLKQVVIRAKWFGKYVVVGGSVMNTSHNRFMDEFGFDTICVGECEAYIDELTQDLENYNPKKIYRTVERPSFDEIDHKPARFDLINTKNNNKDKYIAFCLETSRGCPFNCEYCDIIQVFGRGGRYKSSSQIKKELTNIYDMGVRGLVAFSDDNIYANKKQFRQLFTTLIEWQKEYNYPFELWAQCSINIADNEDDLKLVHEANMRTLFVGVESVNDEVLKSMGKTVNLKGDIKDKLDLLVKNGLDVMTGMIVGFDHEKESSFDDIINFINDTCVPIAYLQVIQGLDGTPLLERLQKEGRIGPGLGQYSIASARTNIRTILNPRTVQEGYAKILESIYDYPTAYKRVSNFIKKMGPRPNSEFNRLSPATLLRLVVIICYMPNRLYLIKLMVGLLFTEKLWRFWRFIDYIARVHASLEFYQERLSCIRKAPITEYEMEDHRRSMKNRI